MPEEDDFKIAMGLLQSGRRKQAATMLLELYDKASTKEFKLKLIDLLIVALDHVYQVPELINISTEGIEIAKELGSDEFASHLKARKALFLMAQISNLNYAQANLKLSPGWLGFATESDKNDFETFGKSIADLETQIDQLLSEAFEYAELSEDKRLMGFILMTQGGIASSLYLQSKGDALRGRRQAKIWLFLHKLGYEFTPLLLDWKDYIDLRSQLQGLKKDFLKAAQLFAEIGDPSEANAYYDLAVHLMTASKFQRSKFYLKKAYRIAAKHKDALLLAQIEALGKSIKTKNKDAPNYLEGETREEIVVDK